MTTSFQFLPPSSRHLFLCVCGSSCLSPRRTPVTGFRAYPDDAGWRHINKLNLIAFAKILFPSEVATSGSRNLDVNICFLGGTIQPTTEYKYFIFHGEIKKRVCTQLCLILYDLLDCSPPGSSVHRILQARILEWVAISSSRRSSQSKDQIQVSCIGRGILYHWATWEAKI